ncbi:MAG: DNA topoisomerase I [Pseudomonadota bacterium]
MPKHLVVVESPAKAKTLKKFLGKDYDVLASYGHVRDLVPKEGAVDPANDFAMRYEVIERNQKHVDAIARALKKADALYLATDPDREGEAISWHLAELLGEQGLLENRDVQRVVFHEITERAIQDAVANPKGLSLELVDAYKARRALDYLVGFNLSPLLWRKIRGGLSAGRVQSPALRMIVERELEIEKFVSREYWSIESRLDRDSTNFTARLTEFDGTKVEQFTFTDAEGTMKAVKAIEDAAGGEMLVANVTKKQRRRNPAPPFTTSTMQQEASRKLGFGAQRTMRTAQKLYEGIDIGQGSVGLITYMRTDSVSLAQEALTELREVITGRYGATEVPETPRAFKTKSKNAQEAHEAIRPTSSARVPADLRQYLDDDQFRLYELIWKRTVACQMEQALYDTVSVDLAAGPHKLRASGSTLVKPGFLAVYQEGQDDMVEEGDRILPPLEKGDAVKLIEMLPEQHFTEPPPRYTEASLVKALEEHGIGRPSTYASIISTLVSREYVELERRRFTPTDVGRVVARFLTEHFERYVDYDFTARLEDELDDVSRGERDWVPLMHAWWKAFKEQVDQGKDIDRSQAIQAREIGTDPKSGRPVSVRLARYGPVVQIGTKDDEEKPKFAGLRPGQKMEQITLEEALELFKLPRNLGETPEGEAVSTNIGRFGPYVKYGSKYVSIKDDDDPYTIELPRALELIAQKKHEDANRTIKDFGVDNIKILRGRYGPYITDGKKNAKVPKDREPESLTLEECQELIAAAPERGKRRGASKKTKAATAVAASAANDDEAGGRQREAARRKTTTTRKKTATKKKAASKKKTTTKKKAASKKKTAAKKKTAKSSSDGE